MNKKERRKSNQVVRDMKECFRSFHLPVNKSKSIRGNQINVVFTSQLCNDHVCAAVFVTHDTKLGYVGISASLHPEVPSEKMTEISKLLNLLDGIRPLYGYSVCQCCNTISWRSVLLLRGEAFPNGKFRRLICEMPEDTYLCAPLIAEVVGGGNSEILYDRFMDDHKDVMEMERKISTEVEGKIMNDMESVLTGLKIHIGQESKLTDGFTIDFMSESMDFPLRMGIRLENKNELVTMCLAAPFIVPDEKISVVTELVTLLNRGSLTDNLFIHRETKRVNLIKGIMINQGALDKMEFETAIRMMPGGGFLLFHIIKEQLSSNESPESLVAKHQGFLKDHS